MKYICMVSVLFAAGASLPLHAQDVTLGGQVRPRFEYREPALDGDDGFTSMRTRLNLSALLERNLRVFIQLQDVRFFGEETNTLGDFSADHLDLHQGYLEVNHSGDEGFDVRVGRQEVNFGGQRLVGAVAWTQQARSFDGARGGYDWERGTVDFFGFKTGDATAATVDQDSEFTGVHARIREVGVGNLELYGFFRRALADDADPTADTNEATAGARYEGRSGKIRFRFESTYQFGDRDGNSVQAFMLGGRIGAAVTDKVTITAWYDYLSGDDDLGDATVKVFDTLFATNHKYYGFADLFLNIPVHTGGYGLQDLALKGAFQLGNNVGLGVDFHGFLFAKSAPGDVRRIGEELDLTLSHRYSPNLMVQAGYSYVVQGTGFEDLGRLTENMQWLYLMLNATF
jgi:hypothetical protein